jgi:hypothetical protein
LERNTYWRICRLYRHEGQEKDYHQNSKLIC